MTTKRTPKSRRDRSVKLTREAIELYRHLKKIFYEGDDYTWNRAHDQRYKLKCLLGRSAPWQWDIFDLGDEHEECPFSRGDAYHDDWPEAQAVRAALDAAISERA